MMNDPSLHVANTALHVISTISSVIMLMLLLCIRCINGNRSFWRDYLAVFYILILIAWTYFMNGLILIVHDYSPLPCSVNNFFRLWLSNQSTMLSSAFALLVLRRLKLAILYWIIPCSLSIILAFASLAFDTSGSESSCLWYENGTQVGSLIIYLVPQLLCLLFNTGVFFYMLVVKTTFWPTSYFAFPLVPLVSQLGSIVNQINLYMTKTQDEGIEWWAHISNGLGGLIILLVFLLDPLFWQGMDLAKCSSLWTTAKCTTGDEDGFMNNDMSNGNDMIKATTKTNSMASSMTTQTSTLTATGSVTHNGPVTIMKEKVDTKISTHIPNLQRLSYQPSLSPHQRDSPIIIFPPPPTTSPSDNVDQHQKHPTSLELDELDFIGMFSKPASLHVDTALLTTHDTTSTSALSPPSPVLLLPLCYEMEDAVPWRVLEADEDEDEDDHHHNNNQLGDRHSNSIDQHRNISDSANGYHQYENGTASNSASGGNNTRPSRYSSSLSASTSGYRKESWLSLYDDDGNEALDSTMYGGLCDEEKADPHHSFTSSSSYTMSEWLTRRGDSFEGVREQMGRTSKSIRRWCRNVNRQQQQQQDDSISDARDRYDDGPRPTLHVVHEEQIQ